MRIFGFKLKRYREWAAVLKEESKEAPLWPMLYEMLRAVLRGEQKGWFRKMRQCYRCPIFDKHLKRCRPWTGNNLGCGCYMPFAALFKKQGWGTENLKEEDRAICW